MQQNGHNTKDSLQTTGFRSTAVQQRRQDDQEGVDLRELAAVIIRRWRVMVCVLAVTLVAGTLYTYTRKPIYESSAKVVVAGSRGPGGGSDSDMPLLSDLKALTRSRSVDTQVEIIASPDLLEEAFHKLSLQMRREGFGDADKLPEWACKVTTKRNTDVVIITTRAFTSEAASRFANIIADTYFVRDLKQNNQATRQAREYAEEKMAIAERDLATANAELSEFKRKTGFIAPEAQLTKAAEQMAQLTLDLDAARAEAVSSRHSVAAIKKQLASQEKQVVASTTITRNPDFGAVVSKINQLESDRAALLQEYAPGSPEVRKVDGQLKQEESRLTSIAGSIIDTRTQTRNPVRESLTTTYATNVAALAASSARAGAIAHELAACKSQAKAMPEIERQFTERMRRVALLERTHETLSAKYYTLLLSEQAVLPNGMLISQARVPEFQAYPQVKMNALMFLLFGLMLAAGAAFVTERLDCRVHDQELAERMSGLSPLSLVPDIQEGPTSLLDEDARGSALMESYRILRNNIAFAGVNQDLRLLAVTSPGPGEGKSTTSVNLAVAMAMEGRNVLLLDCDLRRPALHKHLGVSRNIGFTNVVTGAVPLDEAIVETAVEGLSCMPSGPIPPNPTEFLNSKQSRALIEKLSDRYDTIIVDCPPCAGLSDVQVISTMVDGVMLVVSMDQTLKPQLQIAVNALTRAEAPVLGLVMNRVDTSQKSYSYHYYYYYEYCEDESTSRRRGKHKRRKSA
jgi:capsular exopolysaccharide synthesis family protein